MELVTRGGGHRAIQHFRILIPVEGGGREALSEAKGPDSAPSLRSG